MLSVSPLMHLVMHLMNFWTVVTKTRVQDHQPKRPIERQMFPDQRWLLLSDLISGASKTRDNTVVIDWCIAGCCIRGTPIPRLYTNPWFTVQRVLGLTVKVPLFTLTYEQWVLKWASWDDAIKLGNGYIGFELIMDKAHSGGMFISVTSLSHIF